ncbi:hypothetical protein OROGR_013873 [Orobanche gracilis]
MASSPSSFKTPISFLHIFSIKTTSSSSSLSSTKLKTLFRSFVSSHMYPVYRAFDKAKSFLLKLAKDIHYPHFVELLPLLRKRNKNRNQTKLFFGSFRLHYNWCSSSHVMPLGQGTYNSSPQVYYDSCWNSVVPTGLDNYYHHHHHEQIQECDEEELSRYLQWLEEKGNSYQEYSGSCNEIDKLAELFIANCHEKFRLEKQESYRRFQEMLARSV